MKIRHSLRHKESIEANEIARGHEEIMKDEINAQRAQRAGDYYTEHRALPQRSAPEDRSYCKLLCRVYINKSDLRRMTHVKEQVQVG
jgi:hypothetical protein